MEKVFSICNNLDSSIAYYFKTSDKEYIYFEFNVDRFSYEIYDILHSGIQNIIDTEEEYIEAKEEKTLDYYKDNEFVEMKQVIKIINYIFNSGKII